LAMMSMQRVAISSMVVRLPLVSGQGTAMRGRM